MAVIQFNAFHGKRGIELQVAKVALAQVLEQVGRAGHSYFRFVTAIFNRSQHQPVGVGVLFHFENLADDEFVAVPDEPVFIAPAGYANVINAFDFQSGNSQYVRQFSGRHGNVYVIFKP